MSSSQFENLQCLWQLLLNVHGLAGHSFTTPAGNNCSVDRPCHLRQEEANIWTFPFIRFIGMLLGSTKVSFYMITNAWNGAHDGLNTKEQLIVTHHFVSQCGRLCDFYWIELSNGFKLLVLSDVCAHSVTAIWLEATQCVLVSICKKGPWLRLPWGDLVPLLSKKG